MDVVMIHVKNVVWWWGDIFTFFYWGKGLFSSLNKLIFEKYTCIYISTIIMNDHDHRHHFLHPEKIIMPLGCTLTNNQTDVWCSNRKKGKEMVDAELHIVSFTCSLGWTRENVFVCVCELVKRKCLFSPSLKQPIKFCLIAHHHPHPVLLFLLYQKKKHA